MYNDLRPDLITNNNTKSFLDSFFFEGSRMANYVQIGNDVPPLRAEGIANWFDEQFIEMGL